MARFTQYSTAQYTPLSSQEILMPFQIARERQNAFEEEYGRLQDDAAKVGFIAGTSGNQQVKDIYSNYSNTLSQQADKILNEGVTADSLRESMNMRSQFSRELAPMITSFERQRQELANRDQMLAKDGSLIFQSAVPD